MVCFSKYGIKCGIKCYFHENIFSGISFLFFFKFMKSNFYTIFELLEFRTEKSIMFNNGQVKKILNIQNLDARGFNWSDDSILKLQGTGQRIDQAFSVECYKEIVLFWAFDTLLLIWIHIAISDTLNSSLYIFKVSCYIVSRHIQK